jgi:4-hydroxybenzoyl-CoA thioesterase
MPGRRDTATQRKGRHVNDRVEQTHEMKLSTARPFKVARTVKWGDCDPAGIIYTPRVLDFAMETLEAWYRDVLGIAWLRLNQELHMGAPTVRVEIDFLGAPAPDHEVITLLRVKKLGRASVTYELTGSDGDGKDYYRVVLVACFITRPAFKAAAIPEPFRDRILAYQKECGDG